METLRDRVESIMALPVRVLNEHEREWVEALRSRRFEQGKNFLNRGGKFCCLGVACVLAGVEGVEVEGGKVAYGGFIASLPLSVCEWLGIPLNVNGMMEGVEGAMIILAELNDSGFTFGEIADVIERAQWMG